MPHSIDALPFSEACERNRGPILEVLRHSLPAGSGGQRPRLLEIGSGTGQHAVHAGRELAVVWQASDRSEHLDGLRRRLELEGNRAGDPGLLLPPLELDVTRNAWPAGPFEAVFSANTTHIMPWSAVPALLAGSARVLMAGGIFCLYGPFRYGEAHTSPSNLAFDAHLRNLDPAMGIRDARELVGLATAEGLHPIDDRALPAHNRLLIFRRGDRPDAPEPAGGSPRLGLR